MPVYPLDGGQILQAILWFFIGRVRSLMVVSVIGMVVGGLVLLAALWVGDLWLGVIALYVVYRAVVGFREAKVMSRLLNGPRHKEAACPSCGATPILGNYWTCGHCGTPFDPFTHHGVCPNCASRFDTIRCLECYRASPVSAWLAPAPQSLEVPDGTR
jgi:hypothetical protein